MKKLYEKYKDLIPYAFFGVCTTVVNVVIYYLCYNVTGIPNVPSTIIAWFFAVVFAFITNKLWVFKSKSFEKKILVHEILTFFGCRLATGVLDVVIMWIAVDLMSWNETIWKIISNILVIIINYIASRLVIFKNGRKKTEEDKEEK